jgi:RNA-directed DNA polymerase
MAQPQAITYQYDLFSEQRQDVIRPFPTSETVCGASGTKAFQVKEAGEQERALTPDLMSLVLSHDNIKAAYKQVKRNKGVAGIDQMPTGDFAEWYSQNAETLQSELYNGAYQPQGVKQVEIPKPNGGKRKLGIPTVTDRIIQQAISQVLNPIYERKFSDHSYGFRPNRNAHQALKKGSEYSYKKSAEDIVFYEVHTHKRRSESFNLRSS